MWSRGAVTPDVRGAACPLQQLLMREERPFIPRAFMHPHTRKHSTDAPSLCLPDAHTLSPAHPACRLLAVLFIKWLLPSFSLAPPLLLCVVFFSPPSELIPPIFLSDCHRIAGTSAHATADDVIFVAA